MDFFFLSADLILVVYMHILSHYNKEKLELYIQTGHIKRVLAHSGSSFNTFDGDCKKTFHVSYSNKLRRHTFVHVLGKHRFLALYFLGLVS